MSEERMAVLNMLAENKINAEEAERLLAALDRRDGGGVRVNLDGILSRFGEALERAFGGGPRTDADEPPEGEPVAGAEEGFDMPADAELAVRIRSGAVRVVQQEAGSPASVTSARGNVSLRQRGNRYVLNCGRGGDVTEMRIPPIRALDMKLRGGVVSLQGVRADVTAHVRGGSLSAAEFAGRLAVKMLGGVLDFSGRIEGIDLKCMGGSVTLEDLQIVEGDHAINVLGGVVDAAVSPESSLAVSTKSLGGTIQSDIPALSGGDDRCRHNARYVVGAGAASLALKTVGGTIHLRLGS